MAFLIAGGATGCLGLVWILVASESPRPVEDALDSPAVALDLVQRWRPSADTVFFYRGRYFVVLKWQDADRTALQAFAAELEKRLGKPQE